MGTTTPCQPVQDPETRFASQLEQLANMGFTNRTANIEELQRTGGNVEAAIGLEFEVKPCHIFK